MFENDEFEIYESTTKNYVVKNIYEIIDDSNKHLLKIKKFFNDIKNRYFEMMNVLTN